MRNYRQAAVLLASALLLSACSPDLREVEAPSGTVKPQPTQSAAPVLDEARIQRVVDEVQEVILRADAEQDPKVLQERLTAGALALRTGQIEKAVKTGTEIPPLDIQINVASATVSDSWPRVLLVGSAAASDDPAEVFIFSQADAQSDYMLENWVRALGGNSVRGVAVEDGSKVLKPDAHGFRYSPEEALDLYIKYINDPKSTDVFDDNTFAPYVRDEQKQLKESVKDLGTVTSSAALADYPVTGVELATGEALVATSFTYSDVYARTVAGSTMTLGGTAAAYLTDPNVIGTVTVNYVVNVFFTIPPSDSKDPIRIVGSERAIANVTRDDNAKPAGE